MSLLLYLYNTLDSVFKLKTQNIMQTLPEKENLLERIESDFTYHSPNDDAVQRMAAIRDTAKELAKLMILNGEAGRELSGALTYLELAVNQVNAGIVRNPNNQRKD
jgi:hypothetical protein